MQLEGLLSSFPLRELLELSAASLVNGAIEVQAPSGVHRLFFLQGTLVHATASDAGGFDAFWPLFELEDASFHFLVGATTRERTINEPILPLIAKAEALAQKWARVRPFVPCLDIVPELVSPAKDDRVRIFEEDWPILSMVDGIRTITDVARSAQLDRIEVCVGLLRLKERGLVSLAQQRMVNMAAQISRPSVMRETPPPRQPMSEPAVRAGFFAKLLTDMPADLLEAPATRTAAAPETTAPPPPPTDYDDILSLLRG